MKIALLEGGRSLERGVSLRSGARVRDALTRLGHSVTGLDANSDLVAELRANQPDVAFITLHGLEGEDGTVQQILELLGIPYTGSGPQACSRTVDKSLAKAMLRAAGLPTPDSITLDGSAVRDLGAAQAMPEIGERLGWPLIVKPARGGSALGLSLARSSAEAPAAILAALSYDSTALLEQWVDGRDLALTVIDSPNGQFALPAVEAVPTGENYDFEARYEIGATRFVCPAGLDARTSVRAAELAVEAFKCFGCSGVARVDMLLDSSGELTILELDPVPGMTQTSLTPLAAEAAGIHFDDLIQQIIDLALARN
jgi:D-alanine-D-alanine ligase